MDSVTILEKPSTPRPAEPPKGQGGLVKHGYQPVGKGLDRTDPPRRNMKIEDVIRTKIAQMKNLVKKHPGISVRAFVEIAPGEVMELRAK